MKPSCRRSCSVFVVDDSPSVRERLISLLTELAHATVIGHAQSAPEAILRIRELRPDIVVLDISMPQRSGMNLLASIKADAPPPLVIMVSDFSEEQYRERCQELGADYVFDKSTELDQLIQVVRQSQRGRSSAARAARHVPAFRSCLTELRPLAAKS